MGIHIAKQWLAWAICCLACQQALAGLDSDFNQVIDVDFQALPQWHGQPIDQVSAFRYQQGALTQIPLQIDEYNEEGNPYFPQIEIPLAGQEGLIDPEDHLLLQLKDLGDPMPAALREQKGLAELVFHHGDLKGYVYLQRQAGSQSFDPVARYDRASGEVRTERMLLQTNPDNPLHWADLKIDSDGDLNQARNLLDTMKVRIKAGIITPLTKITISNDNMNARVVAVKHGPVRTLLQTEAKVVVLKVPVMKVHTLFSFYESRVDAMIRADFPAVFEKIMRRPEITLSLDGHELQGSRAMVGTEAGRWWQVDGRFSAAEQELMNTPFDAHNDWWWLHTQGDTDWIISLTTGQGFTPDFSPHYVDDQEAKDEPERFPGQAPNLGYRLTNLTASQVINFTIRMYFTPSATAPAEMAYLKPWLEPPALVASTEAEQAPLEQAQLKDARANSP